MPPSLQVEMLRCPVTGGRLQWLAADRFEQLQLAVRAEQLVNRAGELVTVAPESALHCAAADLAYPIVGGIPALVPGEAISLGQLATPLDPPVGSDELTNAE